jgi:predicted HAD superfamily Cof-like phosphohydrolase
MTKKHEADLPEPPRPSRCDWYEMVKELHETMREPVAKFITPMLANRRVEVSRFMIDEVVNFVASDHIVDQADKLLDLIVFALSVFVEMGVDPNELFDAVHQSNMGKIWHDGKPRYSDYGKLLRPPTWESPEVEIGKILKERALKESEEDDLPF